MYSPSQARAADGQFGSGKGTVGNSQQNPLTTAQVAAWQKAHGLPQTGTFDAATLKFLHVAVTAKAGGSKGTSAATATKKRAALAKALAKKQAAAAKKAAHAKLVEQHKQAAQAKTIAATQARAARSGSHTHPGIVSH